MNERCRTALRYPVARADGVLDDRLWARMRVNNQYLSTIVSINK